MGGAQVHEMCRREMGETQVQYGDTAGGKNTTRTWGNQEGPPTRRHLALTITARRWPLDPRAASFGGFCFLAAEE